MTIGRTRTRLAPADRRQQIIDIATRLVSERGFNTFTLSRLAHDAQITRAGIEHHFSSREDILIAVLRNRDLLDENYLLAQAGTYPTTEREAWDAIDLLVQRNAMQPEIVRLYSILGAEALDPEHPARDYFVERTKWARSVLERSAQSWHSSPTDFAVQILGVLDGLQLQWLRDPSLDLVKLWRDVAGALRHS